MKNLENTLGILPMVETDGEVPVVVVDEVEEPENPDFEYARANMYNILETGKRALDGAMRVANNNDKSRDFEVVGGLLEKMARINNQLLELNKQKVDIKTAKKNGGQGPTQPQIGTQNNAIIVSNSADINKMLEQRIAAATKTEE